MALQAARQAQAVGAHVRDEDVPFFDKALRHHELMHIAPWRDRPRRSLMRWEASRLYGVYAIMTGTAWLAAAENFWGAATGSHHALASGGRLLDAVTGTVALVIAGALTWLAVLYLRRPLVEADRNNWLHRDDAPL